MGAENSPPQTLVNLNSGNNLAEANRINALTDKTHKTYRENFAKSLVDIGIITEEQKNSFVNSPNAFEVQRIQRTLWTVGIQSVGKADGQIGEKTATTAQAVAATAKGNDGTAAKEQFIKAYTRTPTYADNKFDQGEYPLWEIGTDWDSKDVIYIFPKGSKLPNGKIADADTEIAGNKLESAPIPAGTKWRRAGARVAGGKKDEAGTIPSNTALTYTPSSVTQIQGTTDPAQLKNWAQHSTNIEFLLAIANNPRTDGDTLREIQKFADANRKREDVSINDMQNLNTLYDRVTAKINTPLDNVGAQGKDTALPDGEGASPSSTGYIFYDASKPFVVNGVGYATNEDAVKAKKNPDDEIFELKPNQVLIKSSGEIFNTQLDNTISIGQSPVKQHVVIPGKDGKPPVDVVVTPKDDGKVEFQIAEKKITIDKRALESVVLSKWDGSVAGISTEDKTDDSIRLDLANGGFRDIPLGPTADGNVFFTDNILDANKQQIRIEQHSLLGNGNSITTITENPNDAAKIRISKITSLKDGSSITQNNLKNGIPDTVSFKVKDQNGKFKEGKVSGENYGKINVANKDQIFQQAILNNVDVSKVDTPNSILGNPKGRHLQTLGDGNAALIDGEKPSENTKVVFNFATDGSFTRTEIDGEIVIEGGKPKLTSGMPSLVSGESYVFQNGELTSVTSKKEGENAVTTEFLEYNTDGNPTRIKVNGNEMPLSGEYGEATEQNLNDANIPEKDIKDLLDTINKHLSKAAHKQKRDSWSDKRAQQFFATQIARLQAGAEVGQTFTYFKFGRDIIADWNRAIESNTVTRHLLAEKPIESVICDNIHRYKFPEQPGTIFVDQKVGAHIEATKTQSFKEKNKNGELTDHYIYYVTFFITLGTTDLHPEEVEFNLEFIKDTGERVANKQGGTLKKGESFGLVGEQAYVFKSDKRYKSACIKFSQNPFPHQTTGFTSHKPFGGNELCAPIVADGTSPKSLSGKTSDDSKSKGAGFSIDFGEDI